MNTRMLIAALVAATSPFVAAEACTTWTPWPSHQVVLATPDWLPIYAPAHHAAVQRAADIAFNNPSNLTVSLTPDTDTSVAVGNGSSELTFTTSATALCGSDGCAHTIWDASGTPTEVDVFLNASASWETGSSTTNQISYGGTRRALVNTALHEIGHAIGLGHEANVYNIMGTDFEYGSVNGSTMSVPLGADASTCLRNAYGAVGGYEDISVAHWKRVGASGEYSDHARTELRSATGGAMTPVWRPGNEPQYTVKKTKIYQLEYTIEHGGSDAIPMLSFDIYLSADSTIDTSDTWLGNWYYLDFLPGTLATHTVDVTMPSTMTRGKTYWLGIVADSASVVGEVDEVNNIARLVQVKAN